MTKEERKQPGAQAYEPLMDRLNRPDNSISQKLDDVAAGVAEELREEITAFDTDRLLRLVKAAIELKEWPFRR